MARSDRQQRYPEQLGVVVPRRGNSVLFAVGGWPIRLYRTLACPAGCCINFRYANEQCSEFNLLTGGK